MTGADANKTNIANAVNILRAGGVVAFPTETVYGLAADATNERAVARVFEIKGRPSTNPLIVHVADETIARRYATHWPTPASQLATSFWPGPLTLVLPKAPSIVPAVTADRDTVGLRVPRHPLTLELLKQFDGPLTGPSANRSTAVSPTTARHVRDELGDSVELILDGGPCPVGIESTVLDLTTQPPRILRPGMITREQIARVIGNVEAFTGSVDHRVAAASPGLHAKHYSPRTPAYRFESDDKSKLEQWSAKNRSASFAAMLLSARTTPPHAIIIQMPSNPDGYAQQLYGELRRLDEMNLAAIWIEMPPNQPQWTAIRDRLARATVE